MKNFSIRKVYAVFLVMTMIITSLGIQDSTAYAATKAVKSVILKISSKNVTKKTFKMTKGNSKKLKVSIKPASLKKTVTYQSKNKKIVTVSKSGKLKAKKAGTAKVIVTVRIKGNKDITKKTWLKIKVVKKKTTNKKDDTDNNISEDNNSKPNNTTNTIPSNDNNSNKSENDVTSYTVIFDLNYNTAGTYQTVSVPSGEKVAQPENPTRSGYTFDGWYTDTVGGQKFDFNTAITVDTTLYAHWNQISSNGGVSSGTMGSGNGSGGNNNENTNNREITGIAIALNNTTVTGKVKSGDVLTYVTTPVNATGIITWTVGGTTIEQQSYTVTDMDIGKTITVSITGTGNYIGTQKSNPCTVDNTIVFNNKATDPDKNPVVFVDGESVIYKTSDGKEVTLDSSARLNLTIQSSDKQSSNEDTIEMKKAVMENVVGNQDNAEDIKDLTVTALDVDLNLVKTTSEGTTETTEIHPVGETVVTLSASQLGLEGQDISLYYFAAKHKNIDGTEETVRSEFKEINGTQYIRFTLNGLSTIWFGNIPPRTVTFDTDGGTTVDYQKVKFGSCVNISLVEQPTREGYLFCGWNYDLAKTPIISDLTVKAIWIKGEQMPIEQYTVEFTEGTESIFTLKNTNGRITLTLLPEKEIQPNLSYTITINPFHSATKYVTGADAKTVTSNNQYISLDENKLQIKGDITNREGKVNTGTTIAYYKWADAEDTVLALHEIAITIDDGSGTTEKMNYNANVNKGIGTYEAYLLDKDGGENAREPFVAYINGGLNGSYDKGYNLITNAGFDSYRVNNDLEGYDTVELQFSPFEGKSYHESDTINVSANSHFDGISTEQETEYKITEDGKLMITISLTDLGDDSTWGMNVYLYVNVTVNNVTQNINVNIHKYAEGNKKYFETDNWDEVVSKLSEGEAYNIHYMGSDVTLTSSLTIPANCNLIIRNANLTVGKGAVLTLDAEVKNVARIEILQGTFTIADGGILTTVSQPKSYYRIEIVSNAVIIQNGGQVINPENGVLGLWGAVNTSPSFMVESGAIIKNSGDIVIRNFNDITINGTIDSTSYTEIYGNTITVSGTIKQSKNPSLRLYGEIIITKTGSFLIDAANNMNMFHCLLTGALNNQGTIQVTNGNVSLSNTRYSVYNSGIITIDSGIIRIRGTKLINTGTIRGTGTLQCFVSDDNTNYDNGIEYVEVANDQYWDSELQQIIYKTEDYSRYKYTHDPVDNVDITLYKSEVINEGSGTCAAKIDTEEFPEKK